MGAGEAPVPKKAPPSGQKKRGPVDLMFHRWTTSRRRATTEHAPRERERASGAMDAPADK
jgi:hypothetical protein